VADHRINDVPIAPEFVRFRSGFGQRFLVTVDVEEEFDWHAPLDRHQHGIEAVPALRKFQHFCEGFGVCPVYLVDYPIATSLSAKEALHEPIAEGRAEVGVQLHPWVNPPHDEVVNAFNSYAGNLPLELERAKFMMLRDAIERNFGAVPRIYRAGRYGTGANTARILCENGITIDTSVRSGFDYSAEGGPNYRGHPLRPYWIDRDGGLIELPLTTVYWGALRRMGSWLYPKMWRIPQLRGALAHARLLDRIPMTPEGVSAKEAMHAIDVAADMELPILVLSFHSPSLRVGNTPYIRDHDDLDAFYDWWRAIFAHMALRKIAPTGIGEIMDAVELA
jgi:hypothetical protein